MVEEHSFDPDQLPAVLQERANHDLNLSLDSIEAASLTDKKELLQLIRELVDDDTTRLEPVQPILRSLVTDDERSVRLTTAKLLVSVAEENTEAVVPFVPSFSARLADEDEFYFVRARSAEALGYVALEHPQEVASPEVLADLRVGLSFDEPEVKQKLAKALEYIALGDPKRLRHHVPNLAVHLDDEDELVRYHLCTALVIVGSAFPSYLSDAVDALVERLTDECVFVRGRAAEALGLLATEDVEGVTIPKSRVEAVLESDESFAVDRARFAYQCLDETTTTDEMPAEVGTIESIRETTADVAEEIESPDVDGECPHCGLPLPEDGPPTCPRCGGPY